MQGVLVEVVRHSIVIVVRIVNLGDALARDGDTFGQLLGDGVVEVAGHEACARVEVQVGEVVGDLAEGGQVFVAAERLGAQGCVCRGGRLILRFLVAVKVGRGSGPRNASQIVVVFGKHGIAVGIVARCDLRSFDGKGELVGCDPWPALQLFDRSRLHLRGGRIVICDCLGEELEPRRINAGIALGHLADTICVGRGEVVAVFSARRGLAQAIDHAVAGCGVAGSVGGQLLHDEVQSILGRSSLEGDAAAVDGDVARDLLLGHVRERPLVSIDVHVLPASQATDELVELVGIDIGTELGVHIYGRALEHEGGVLNGVVELLLLAINCGGPGLGKLELGERRVVERRLAEQVAGSAFGHAARVALVDGLRACLIPEVLGCSGDIALLVVRRSHAQITHEGVVCEVTRVSGHGLLDAVDKGACGLGGNRGAAQVVEHDGDVKARGDVVRRTGSTLESDGCGLDMRGGVLGNRDTVLGIGNGHRYVCAAGGRGDGDLEDVVSGPRTAIDVLGHSSGSLALGVVVIVEDRLRTGRGIIAGKDDAHGRRRSATGILGIRAGNGTCLRMVLDRGGQRVVAVVDHVDVDEVHLGVVVDSVLHPDIGLANLVRRGVLAFEMIRIDAIGLLCGDADVLVIETGHLFVLPLVGHSLIGDELADDIPVISLQVVVFVIAAVAIVNSLLEVGDGERQIVEDALALSGSHIVAVCIDVDPALDGGRELAGIGNLDRLRGGDVAIVSASHLIVGGSGCLAFGPRNSDDKGAAGGLPHRVFIALVFGSWLRHGLSRLIQTRVLSIRAVFTVLGYSDRDQTHGVFVVLVPAAALLVLALEVLAGGERYRAICAVVGDVGHDKLAIFIAIDNRARGGVGEAALPDAVDVGVAIFITGGQILEGVAPAVVDGACIAIVDGVGIAREGPHAAGNDLPAIGQRRVIAERATFDVGEPLRLIENR